jgi:hypothetical protein
MSDDKDTRGELIAAGTFATVSLGLLTTMLVKYENARWEFALTGLFAILLIVLLTFLALAGFNRWPPEDSLRTGTIVGVFALVLITIIVVVSEPGGHDESSTKLSTTTLVQPPSNTKQPRATTTTRLTTTTATPTTATAPATYLSSLTPNGNADPMIGSPYIDGTKYPNSIWINLGSCNPGETHSQSYELEKKYSTFTAVAGLTDDSAQNLPAPVDFSVTLNGGSPVFDQTLKQDQAAPITLNVSGVVTLTLTETTPFPAASNRCAGTDVYPGWGSARVTP